jgi:integrase/recombinase XerD
MKKAMQTTPSPRGMRLYDDYKRRLYLNEAERGRFLDVADKTSEPIRSLALTLAFTGCRISEALELTASSVQIEDQRIAFRCLKKRGYRVVMREVPIPLELAKRLDQVHDILAAQRDGVGGAKRLWPISRKTAWVHIKRIMTTAEISGAQATIKGLRHGYGVHAIHSGVQLNMLQKWMGHAAMETTAIYANATGPEELEVAGRMWG